MARFGRSKITEDMERHKDGFCPDRRALLSLCAAAILAATGLRPAAAQPPDYPSRRPIQVYVPFAGGSASDVITRILLNRMAISLGQAFVVDNRPGAGGNIGTAAAAHAAPDGYNAVDEHLRTSGCKQVAVQGARLRSTEGSRADRPVRRPAERRSSSIQSCPRNRCAN